LRDALVWPPELIDEFVPEDILEAWATSADDSAWIAISRVNGYNESEKVEAFDTGTFQEPSEFDVDAADLVLSESGYRRVTLWLEGMGPRTDRHGNGPGVSCEVVKVSESLSSAT
jgi:hypothetical protein